jgi:hypothetical protein
MKPFELKNMLVKAKVAERDIDQDWLKTAKDQAINARQRKFTKLPSFPLAELCYVNNNQYEGASEEDPAVFQVEATDEPREVTIASRIDPQTKKPQVTKVLDIHVTKSSDGNVHEDETYTLWYTTVLAKELDALKPPVKGQEFILCYYGRKQKGKKPASTDPHIFRVIPQ